MESYALYLFKSAAWLSAFAIVYLLFLRKERYFILKRIYLLTGIIVSILFPLITVHYQVELPAPTPVFETLIISQQPGIQQTVINNGTTPIQINYGGLAAAIYVLGMVVLATRNIWHFTGIFKAIRKKSTNNGSYARIIRSSEFPSSFSFFNYVFVNPSINEDELKEIMNHELVHVNQKHWFDLLLAELMRILQWANPFAWIYTVLIRLNHEYLADEVALQRSSDPAFYRALLLNHLFKSPVISLSNSFNYSITKTRFEMMKKIVTSPYRKLKVLVILPAFAIILYSFASPEYHYAKVENGSTQPLYIYETSPVSTPTTDKTDLQSGIQQSVKGIVRDQSGKPLAGVMVTSTGTVGNAYTAETNKDGFFELRNVQKDARIVINARGYKGVSVIPEFSKQMEIKLEAEQSSQAVFSPQDRPRPIVVIDGVITDKTTSDARKELGHNFGIAKLVQGKEATDKYGEKGKNGAFEIFTRKRALEMGLNPPYPRIDPDDYPTFQGKSLNAINDWVKQQVVYPPEARTNGLQGWVFASFTIEPDGSISNITPTGEADKILKDEIVRILNSAPKFEPAKNPEANEPLPFSIALKFKLPDLVINDAPFVVVENMPLYPGGDAALLKYLKDNTHYPESARARMIEGRVILRFIVSPEGTTEGISVLKGVDPDLDAEAIRVVKSLSGWQPGRQGGKDVYVWYMCPVTFELAPMPFSSESAARIVNFVRENVMYPREAKDAKLTGKIFLTVSIEKGGILKESRVFAERPPVNIPVLPEIVVVGNVQDGDKENKAATGNELKDEALRVANLLNTLDIPEWKEKDTEFGILLNFTLPAK